MSRESGIIIGGIIYRDIFQFSLPRYRIGIVGNILGDGREVEDWR